MSVTESAESLYGDGALRVWLEPSSKTPTEDKHLTWILGEDDAAFNWLGATHLSLWYKVPTEQDDVDLTLLLLDDSACSDQQCAQADNLMTYASESFTLGHDESEDRKELKVGLPLGEF